MPMADLEEMLEAATVLEARERLALIADGQVAAGLATKAQSRRHLAELREAASVRPTPGEAAAFEELGFEVVRVGPTCG